MTDNSEEIPCPCKIGSHLTLSWTGGSVDVKIVQTFRGSGRNYFSNSCAVLVERISLPTPFHAKQHDLPAQFVVKIMDWRFTMDIRDRMFGPWNLQRQDECMSMSFADHEAFENHLASPISTADASDDFVKMVQEVEDISLEPLVVDLYGYIAYLSPAMSKNLVRDRRIPRELTVTEREMVLNYKNKQNLAAEVKIANIVDKKSFTFMPRPYGVCTVKILRTSDTTEDIRQNEATNHFQILGLMMSRVAGQPLALIDTSGLTKQAAKDILDSIQEFQLQLWEHNLEFADVNTHNILVETLNDGRARLQMVDFGAIRLVDPTDCRLYKVLQDDSEPLPLPDGAHVHYFTCSTHFSLLEYVRHGFKVQFPDPKDYIDNIEESVILYKWDMMSDEDLIVWHTITHQLRHVIMSSEARLIGHTWRNILIASRLMYEELERPRSLKTAWWRRALDLIQDIIGIDVMGAQEAIEKIIEMLAPRTVIDDKTEFDGPRLLSVLQNIQSPVFQLRHIRERPDNAVPAINRDRHREGR